MRAPAPTFPPATPTRAPMLALPVSALHVGFAAVVFFAAFNGFFRLAPSDTIWMAIYGLMVLWAVRTPERVVDTVRTGWPLLLLPAFALASAVWSVAPGRTVYAALQLIMATMIALRITRLLSTRQILYALFIAQGAGLALSLLNLATGMLPPVYEVNGALLGTYTHKTGVGKAALWSSFAFIGICAYHRVPLLGALFAAATLPVAVMAQSVTSQLGYGFIALLLGLLALRRLPMGVRAGVPLALLLFAVAALLVFVATGGELLQSLLDMAGKGRTLTGRTVLWAIALDTIAANPVGGVGFNAFWTSAAYSDVVTYIHINVDDGLNGFHNGYLETFVALGAVGGVYLIGLVALTLWRLSLCFIQTRALEAAIWLAAFTLITGLMVMEDSFFKLHSAHYMIAVMAVRMAIHLDRKRRAASG